MTDNTQSEALDLADWLDGCGGLTSKSAAAEVGNMVEQAISAEPAGAGYAAWPEPEVHDEGGWHITYYTATMMRDFADRTHALRASHGQAPAQTADSQLLQFYGVTTDAELIAAQAAHIEKLQAKLTKTPSFAPQRVREG